MKNIIYISIIIFTTIGCKVNRDLLLKENENRNFDKTFIDSRDNNEYGVIEIGENVWFAENLKFQSPKSKCYKNKKGNCIKYGRIYPSSELETACPKGWRVPNINDWENLKSQFGEDSIYSLLDTINWSNPMSHTNESRFSLRSTGYQMEKRLFIGEETATSMWLNQINKYDEYYHIHIFGGKGVSFEKSGYVTNEVFHAHPIKDLENRRFSIRCICNKKQNE